MKLFSKIAYVFGVAAVLSTMLTFGPGASQAAPAAAPPAGVAVKEHTRVTKTGKVITVKGYTRTGKPAVKTVTVKGYTRKTKSGKVITVKSYTRKETTGKKPAASHM